MGTATPPVPVKLIAGLLASSDALLGEAAAALSDRFGVIDGVSTPTDWTASTYYAGEMGAAIRRQFLSFEPLIGPGKLAGIKQLTNEIERRWRTGPGRQVNIDPGYVAAMKLVLASTKDAAHRVYLSGGLYAEATLQFVGGTFCPHAYTYPDYAATETLQFFNAVRQRYLAQLRPLH